MYYHYYYYYYYYYYCYYFYQQLDGDGDIAMHACMHAANLVVAIYLS